MKCASHRAFIDNLRNQITGTTDCQNISKVENKPSDNVALNNDVLRDLINQYDKLFGNMAETA